MCRGNSDSYFGDDWHNHGLGYIDAGGNYHWFSGYTQEELNNWEGPWYGGWVYGWGYVYVDVNTYPNKEKLTIHWRNL